MRSRSLPSLLFGLVLTLAALTLAAIGLAAHLRALGRLEMLADILAMPLLAGSGVVLLLALWRRAAAPLVLATVAVGLLTTALLPAWRGDISDRPADFTVYMANLWARNEDTAAAQASVQAADADIVVLIELGDAQAEQLDQLLAGYPHRVSIPRVDRPSGAARSLIASRHPMRPLRGPSDGLSVVGAVIDLPSGPVTVLGAHLTRPWPFVMHGGQIWQSRQLARRIEAVEGPLVLVGDFNAVPHGRVLSSLESETGLTVAPAVWGTWPAPLPAPLRISIDNALVSQELAVTRRSLGAPTGSDHRPIVIGLARR
ncbi:endonuclease/exonuclease/phosphatase family protein [Brevundimonas sp. 2R-24]|uniref:Endonuclease/exonuclease/phosphatase family protein n=1 Tax=Peiella sedimenti TaxID=3061083 RepID=A0ABT8SIQ7_9CAUL|nr:endonuclease/exonuclease/phosphatase family protein [Caulobacteraceae bacterium XZ-24]